ncbi:hypothetical protein EJ03DRAFT_270409 [Teratosphaeria nubilosa]|uniref:Rad21/Rec8-like protein N-terminal domain-containing protein n=1 Tax=Teratosphaeria nubilosa TaxID=161662 RepID=A0A6G1LD94_9PEZI|nr:hypothetical protein EJ03DRAFT_270409 [Teratosphaeria nubilosa]
MFYAEDLLTKNGPLARVWLASNLERKLSKQNVLSEKIETKVKDIIGTGQAPIALRLSGQLLLGVVRIYSRKARYLLDDCNEALVKIKLAFRSGNVDLPSHQTHTAARDALILPDTITDLDLFAPLPDPEELLREPETTRAPGRDPTMLDFGTSQLLPETQTPSREKQSRTLLDDDDLGLDLGLEPGDEGLRSTPGIEDRSVEVGRRAHTPKADQPTMLDLDDDLGLDYGLGNDTTIGRETSTAPPAPADDDDMPMFGGDDDFPMAGMDDETAERNAAALSKAAKTADERRQRDSASPLSSARSSVARDLEETFHVVSQAQLHEQEEDATMVQAAQRVKRRKVMKQDYETELHNSQIKKQQQDRSGILKAPSFLPRDPLLMQLMEMQSNGGFVSSIMGDGRMQGWAPELRGILSIELVTKAGEKKRKRDSGVADVETGSERQETPQLEIPQDDEGFEVDAGAGGDFGGDTTLDDQPLIEDDYAPSPGAPFDQTEVPLLHPSQTGPVSIGTKNAVHLLREHFAPDHPADATEPPTPSKRAKNEALFTDLCPEATTTRADATKMFFEMLVLGTKDAIKVEQDSRELGLPIRVRGKRGLWGDWAEKGAGGEIASQTEQPQEVEAEA